MDKNPNNAPVMTWILYNAIPVKWEIDELDAKKSDIVIESIQIVFSNMDVVGTSWFLSSSLYYNVLEFYAGRN